MWERNHVPDRGNVYKHSEVKGGMACVYGGSKHHSEWPDSVTDGLYVVVEGEDV